VKLIEIDLSKGKEHEHPDFNDTDNFLCKIDGELHVGRFDRQWYGWNFRGWRWNMAAGLQYDTPGWNSSRWGTVW